MSRRGELSPEDRRIWARVSGTVTPGRRAKPMLISPPDPPAAPHSANRPSATKALTVGSVQPVGRPASHRSPAIPETLEPRRQRRLARERDQIEARIDLHGHGRFQAEDALVAFLVGAQARGLRAVLVITGQGRRGGGVIRASIQEWLAGPRLRGVVSGFSNAHRRHGGDGAVYVALRVHK